MGKKNPRMVARARRKKRVRSKVRGSAANPRLNIFRSAKNIYAQIIDDAGGLTLVAASTLSPEVREKKAEVKGKIAPAKEVGLILAAKAKKKGITQIVFDRSGFLYHGRVAAVAEGAREGGLKL